MNRHWMGAAAAAAVTIFACGTALADPAPAAAPAEAGYPVLPQAVVGGDYSYLSANHGGQVNDFGGEAGGIIPFGDNFSGQVLGAYHNLSENHGGGSFNNYQVGGDLAWNWDMGRIGANVAYDSDTGHGVTGNITNYGVFGEYYASDQFTVGLRGG